MRVIIIRFAVLGALFGSIATAMLITIDGQPFTPASTFSCAKGTTLTIKNNGNGTTIDCVPMSGAAPK